jgi:hypothetical protein
LDLGANYQGMVGSRHKYQGAVESCHKTTNEWSYFTANSRSDLKVAKYMAHRFFFFFFMCSGVKLGCMTKVAEKLREEKEDDVDLKLQEGTTRVGYAQKTKIIRC